MNITYTLNDLAKTAKQVIGSLSHNILLFDGDMGVGKTTLIKEICLQLGVQDVITSPTYSLVNEYKGTSKKIYHFDFYRIQEEEEAFDIGFEEYLDSDAWIFIEWPEKIINLLPEKTIKIEIKLLDNGKRALSMH
ncbi:tRNA (adenosine(37)-N6)-threonylcarbamoyltransferase complex ATPase subunit type 1 TsaE [Aquimarina addita]|uniref:tRNA threonylcarbamoyladenosine biosynthesis protein TsaE n=1 Tax=Aquimarina addita TaxID=870485 RepID=A0ABP7XHT0_9FLAO